MAKSMREAIVKLLYKRNDHKNIKNWRPISLLNTDYKILSKIIVNRLIPIFENYIYITTTKYWITWVKN